jgi:hypothetical protein
VAGGRARGLGIGLGMKMLVSRVVCSATAILALLSTGATRRTVVHTTRCTFKWRECHLAPERTSAPTSSATFLAVNCTRHPALTGCGVCLAVSQGPRPRHGRAAETRRLSAARACGLLRARQSKRQRRAPRPPRGLSALDRFLRQETEYGIVRVRCLPKPDGPARRRGQV